MRYSGGNSGAYPQRKLGAELSRGVGVRQLTARQDMLDMHLLRRVWLPNQPWASTRNYLAVALRANLIEDLLPHLLQLRLVKLEIAR